MVRRMDWEKAKRIENSETGIDPDAQDRYFNVKSSINTDLKIIKNGIWPSGKHAGKQINQLPEQYLIYAGKNFKTKHLKHAANNELIRRFNTGEIKIQNFPNN